MTYIAGGQVATARDWKTTGYWVALFWACVNYVAVFWQTLFKSPQQLDQQRKASGKPALFKGSGGGGGGGGGGGPPRPGGGQPRLSGMDALRRPARLSQMPCASAGG